MKEIKLKLHSIVDLITNSSTVIYTYSHGCDVVLEKLFNELRDVFNIKESINDMFYISTLCDDDGYYSYLSEKLDNDDWENKELEISEELLLILKDENADWKALSNAVNEAKEDVKYNRTEKPKWMHEAEKDSGWDGFASSTYINIIPKEEKYEKVATLFYNLIYSTDHEATRDG